MATVVYPGSDRLRPRGGGDGQALRRAGRGLPGEPPAAQGCGREGDRVCDAVVVALGAGVDAGAGAGRSGSLVRRGVRSPPPRPEHRGRAGGRRVAAGRCRSCRSGPSTASSGSSRATRWSSSRPTATACRPATPAPRSRSAPGSASCTWRSTRPRATGSRGIAARSPAPGRRSARAEHASMLERAVLEQFTTSKRVPAQTEPAARRAGPGRGRQAPRRAAPTGWSSIWSSTRGSRRWPGDERLPAHLQPRDRPRAGHPAARRLMGPRRDPRAARRART